MSRLGSDPKHWMGSGEQDGISTETPVDVVKVVGTLTFVVGFLVVLTSYIF